MQERSAPQSGRRRFARFAGILAVVFTAALLINALPSFDANAESQSSFLASFFGWTNAEQATDAPPQNNPAAVNFASAVNRTVCASGCDLPTIAAAVAEVNAAVPAGGVTYNIAGGHTETAPAGGYTITATGTATDQIIFQRDPGTMGANPVITASNAHTAGSLHDAVFEILGGDYITLSGLTMLENPANTTTAAATNNMTEWGVALLYASTTNGAQNVSLLNNTIDLDRTYQNTFGIYSNSTHSATTVTTTATATTAAGANSGLKVYNNVITDVNNGIVVVGPTAAADNNEGLDIGGASIATTNSITNFGTTGTFSAYANVSGTVNGILVRNTRNFNVSFNTVTSSNGGTTAGTLNGIQVPAFSNAPTGTFTNSVSNNIISLRSAVAAGAINGINIGGTSASVTSTINVNNNDFNNFGHTVAASGAITFLTQGGAHLNQNVNNNTFTNNSVNTTGSVTFISNSNTNPGTGTKNVNNNSIVTGFTKTGAGGTITFFTDNGSDPLNAVNNVNNNNFSNITLGGGAAAIAGIANTNGGSPTKNVTGNIISNINTGGGTGTVTLYSINFDSSTTTVSGNVGSGVTHAGAITGILFGTSGTGTTNASQNTFHTLTGSGTGIVTGISVGGTTGTTRNIFRNKIYNLENTNAGGGVSGITVSTGTTINVFNNLVGDLRAPNLNATNSLFGINISGGTNVTADFNTVYLNATSAGTNFGSSALNASTTPNVTLRNNILVNLSTPNGTGLTVAYRRSTTTLTTYNAASNNNDFFAGTPSATRLIYFDGTNADQTLAQYKARVAPRDSSSVTENPNFLSTNGADATFLHINPATPTQLESGGIPVTGITTDYDGDTRNATAPDIGADEFAGIPIDLSPPTITYTPLTQTTSVLSRTITATITDISGIAGGANSPRIYYRKNGGMYVSTQCVFVSGNNYDCTIDYSLVGGAAINDVIDYFIVAQDVNGNVGANPGAGFAATDVNNVTSPPTSPNSYRIVGGFPASIEVGTGETFTSLTNAGGVFEALNAGVLVGNVTIDITSDLTGETGAVALNQQVEEGSSPGTYTLTFKPVGAARVISGANGTGALIRLNGTDRVTIDGSLSGGTDRSLTITNTSTATNTAAIQISSLGAGAGAVNNTVKNTNLSCGADQSTSTNVTYGISHGGTLLGNSGADNDNNSFINNAITKVNIGIYSSGESAANQVQNTVISDNLIGPAAFGADQIGRAGIIFNLTNNATVTGNEVRFVGVLEPQTSSGGSYDKFGISHAFNGWSDTTFGDLAVSNTLIARNKVHDIVEENTFSAAGIFMAGGNGANDTLNRTVNNFVWNVRANGTSGDNSVSIGIASGKADTVAFNSIYAAGDLDPGAATAASQSSFGIQITSTTVVNLTLRDNISYVDMTSNTATLKHGAIKIPASFAWGTGGSNYNDLYAPNAQGIVGRVGTTDALTLADWQTASGQDANSKSVDPLFVSTTDLHLQSGSTLRGMGIPVAGVTNDIDGDTRHPATPDIGADEFASFVLPTVQFNSATYTGAEGTTATITVTRTGDTSVASSVNYATSDGTATGGTSCGAGVDYVSTSGTLNFAASETSQTFNVTLCSDAITKGDETVNLTLSSPTGATLGTPSTAVLTITNVGAPTPGVLALSSATYTVGEAGGTVTITVNRTGGTDGEVSVNYSLADGTATGGAACGGAVDYVNTGGTVTFAGGESSKTFTVGICNDSAVEGDETFTVTISGATGGATIGTPSSATVTITDDDMANPGVLALSSATYTVGEAAGTVTVTVNRTGGTDGAVAVNYGLTDGTATGGAACGGAVDYVNTGGTVNFAAGQSSQTFTVTICNDASDESDETFTVTLSGATGGATIGTPASAVVTITDDDNPPPAGNVIVNPGNVAYMTLKEAFDAINAGTHTGAITIDIAGNTTETASAVLNASGIGAASYTSVVIAPTGGARVIEGNVVGSIIKLNGADNVTIDGRLGGVGRNLTVRNNSTATATAAIWVASVAAGNGATNNVIRNLEIAAGQTAFTGTNVTIGVLMSGGTTIAVTTDGTDNDNNQFIANRITRARYGLVTRGTAANNNEGLVVTDNIVGPASFGADEIGKVGIYLQADTGALVSRNTVQYVGGDLANATAGTDRCGICIGNENWGQAEATVITSGDYTVTKNIVHDVVEERTFSAVGIRLGTTRAGMPTNNLVANNFVYNIRSNGTLGDQVAGIGYVAGHTDRIVFNSISLTGDMDPAGAVASTIYGNAMRVSTVNGTNNANLTMMNNSIYLDVNSNTAANHYYTITLPAAAYSFGTGGLNYNNYYFNPANPQLRTGAVGVTSGNTPGPEFLTLANWQTALTPPQDANSKQVDPQYFSPTGDLHILNTSPNIDMGTPIAGITDDIDSQTRPNGAAPDIGADEFYPSPGTLQFSSTNYSATEQSGTVTITVTRTGGATGAVSVSYATSDGTAVGGASCGAGIDYVTTSGTLMWGDNDLAPKTFTVTLCNDGIFKGGETFSVNLSNPTGGATLGTPSTATVTILDSTIFTGTITVGAGGTFPSLTNPGGLFEAINNGGVSGNLTVNIISDLTAETGAVALNQFAGGFTMLIQPTGGARLISGGSATDLLNFNGADGVTINGLNADGNSLTIRNTATGTGTAIRFVNDASNNSVLNTRLEGGGTSSVLFIATGTTTGNDNITVTGNIIRDRTDATSVPFNVINLAGTSAAVSNSNILINNNQLINFAQAGLFVANADDVTFTDNEVFQTASRTTALFGVAVNSMLGTNLFSQNSIHDLTTSLATTGLQFNDVRATTVSRNRIYNFPSTSGSTGILTGIVFNGATAVPASLTVVNNMVSIIPNFTNNQIIRGIFDFGFATNVFTSHFNTVLLGGTSTGAADSWACIRGTQAPTVHTMTNNICFNNRTGGTGDHFAAGDQSPATGTFTSNYNIFVGTGTANAANFFDKGTVATGTPVNFASWQAGPPPRDANSQASNPVGNYTVANMFVSPTDLHLNTTGTNPALNAGIPVEGITTDFDGQTRDATPDIGADEVVFNLPGTLSLSSSTYSVPENGVMVTITVNRAMGTVGAVSVSYTLGNGTATGGASCGAGVDFVNTGGTVNFAEGESTKTFIVQICDDTVFEGDETFTVTLTNPQGGAVLGTPSSAIVTIVENDPMPVVPSLTINDVTVQEGNSGTTTATFTVTVTNPNDQPISVQYMTVNGTALAGLDYVAASGTLNIPAGQTTGTISVTIIGDTIREANETFFVNLSSPTNATITDNQGVGIIVDNDRAVIADFDNDRKSDFSVWRPGDGFWYTLLSTNNVATYKKFGTDGDKPVPGDYDGDGIADIAVFRPSDATWYIQRSSDFGFIAQQWGLASDRLVQGDYDGDGKTDIAVWRNGMWFVIQSSNGNQLAIQFGQTGDIPVQGDYDGDAKTDFAVYRGGTWYVLQSSNGAFVAQQWGLASDTPIVGDFDGDGSTDFTVYRDGTWYILQSLTDSFRSVSFGTTGDIPVPADFDGDGKTDVAVFRPNGGNWYVLRSSDGAFATQQWGQNGDVPIPAAYQSRP